MRIHFICLGTLLSASYAFGSAANVGLGTAQLFSLFGGLGVTNTGASRVDGDVGTSALGVVTGFPPAIVTSGTIDAGDSLAMQALADVKSAYNSAAGQACSGVLTGQNLGGLILMPGVYCFSSTAQLNGNLTLDAQGDPNAVFLFQVGSTLTTASGASVSFINGGQGGSVFWQVGSSATLGADTLFAGNILAMDSVTLNTGADIQCGRVLSVDGTVTMDTNQVATDSLGCLSGVPEPGTATMLSIGLLFAALTLYLRQSPKPATHV